jgi:hypothetical protein
LDGQQKFFFFERMKIDISEKERDRDNSALEFSKLPTNNLRIIFCKWVPYKESDHDLLREAFVVKGPLP